MQIKDLVTGQPVDSIEVEITSISEPRSFQSFHGSGRVANAGIKDETGEFSLVLWNEDIDKVKTGDRVLIENGYVKEFRGERQLTTGRQGKMTVLGSEEGVVEEPAKEENRKKEVSEEEETTPEEVEEEEEE